jgi:predicted permease
MAAAATAVLIGLWPALQISRADPNPVLRDGRGEGGSGGRPGRQRMRSVLAIGQVAGSLVLLIVAGLFIRSLDRAQRMNLGFNPDHVLNVRMDPSHAGYDRPRTVDFYRELERRVRRLPGVQNVSLAFRSPLGYLNDSSLIYLPGRPSDEDQPPLAGRNSISGDYFETLQIPIVSGRSFRESDTAAAPLVAIVNETFAARFFPGQDPTGQRFRSSHPDGPLWQVVGVARDSKYMAVAEAPMPYYYTPLTQLHYPLRVLQIRSNVPPERLAPVVEREIRAVDPDVPIADLQSMRQSLNGMAGFLVYRIGALQASAMGALGLLLSIIGVYGVVSSGAAQRTHEIGIRMALGAAPADIRRMVLGQGVALVAAGLAVGVAGALALSRVTTKVVLLVDALDPLTYAGVTLLLSGIALWACYIPARRAMRLDPLNALRHE